MLESVGTVIMTDQSIQIWNADGDKILIMKDEILISCTSEMFECYHAVH